MKKTEYAGVKIADEANLQLELDSTKHDEQALPAFSKDVPVNSRRHDHGESTVIEYEWKEPCCSNIHIQEITYRKGTGLDGFFRLNSRDGSDSASCVHNNTVYIFRKTSKEIAKAIYNTYLDMASGLENIVGWLTSILGNHYIISKVDRLSWSFDKRIARNGTINYIEKEALGMDKKKEIFDLIIQNIAQLHSKGYVLGNFTINSILLLNGGLCFTDMRGLRQARKRSYGVEEFRALLQYLFAIGFMESDEAYYSIAMYHGANPDACSEWHREKTGAKSKDELEITNSMEKEIF